MGRNARTKSFPYSNSARYFSLDKNIYYYYYLYYCSATRYLIADYEAPTDRCVRRYEPSALSYSTANYC